jgi:hypothetical protein
MPESKELKRLLNGFETVGMTESLMELRFQEINYTPDLLPDIRSFRPICWNRSVVEAPVWIRLIPMPSFHFPPIEYLGSCINLT